MLNYKFLAKTSLFRNMSESEIKEVIEKSNGREKEYKKSEVIMRAGSTTECMGIILYGSVNVVKYDVWGNQSIMDNLESGMVFAEVYSCARNEVMTVNVLASRECTVLFLNMRNFFETGANLYCNKFVVNLIKVLAEKNLNLTRKISHMSPKSIRSKVLSYLSFQAVSQGKDNFFIPFNRQQMADYLSVDRSALSNELSKLEKEGVIAYRKNHFILKGVRIPM